jgi:hypothetical protein
MYTWPSPDDTPHGAGKNTFVAVSGPPTPPATVVMVPAAVLAVAADAHTAGPARAIAVAVIAASRGRILPVDAAD